jgi:WhiB family redox-sensing transcriptional regulator
MSAAEWSPGAAGPLLRIAPDLTWQDRALCAEIDPELFFVEKGNEKQAQVAKAVCRRCEIREACLEYALDREAQPGVYGAYGVYGGMSPAERDEVRRRRREGRAA